MKKMITIDAKGITYPCYPTAGAMLRFRRRNGKEIHEIDLNDTEDTSGYLFCCAASACNREDTEFPFKDEQDFMDYLLPEDVDRWAISVAESQRDASEGEPDEKKAPHNRGASRDMCGADRHELS